MRVLRGNILTEPPFTMSDLEEIYPYASGYSKEHPEYKEEAQTATAELQSGKKRLSCTLAAHYQCVCCRFKEDLYKVKCRV